MQFTVCTWAVYRASIVNTVTRFEIADCRSDFFNDAHRIPAQHIQLAFSRCAAQPHAIQGSRKEA